MASPIKIILDPCQDNLSVCETLFSQVDAFTDRPVFVGIDRVILSNAVNEGLIHVVTSRFLTCFEDDVMVPLRHFDLIRIGFTEINIHLSKSALHDGHVLNGELNVYVTAHNAYAPFDVLTV